MIRVSLHLTEQEIRQLKMVSETTGMSVAEIIRRAVDEHLKKVKRKQNNNRY